MNIEHHPDDATLLRYAAGNLDEVFATVVAAHLAACPECRARIRAIEAVGGTLLCAEAEAPLREGSFERLLERLDVEPAAARKSASRPAGESAVPLTIERLLGGSLESIRWRTVAPGVATHRIPVSAGSNGSLILLKIAPGKKVPEHGHGGSEMTLILEGSYRDELGRFRPGDVADLDEHVEHQPVVDSDIPCICLVATEQPTRFKGLLSRLLQPIVGI